MGAASSYLAGFATDRTRYRRDLDQQWTARKLDLYVNYMNDIKQMRELARRIAGGIGLDARPQPLSRDEGLPLLAEAEARRSVSGEMVALIGSEETIKAHRVLNAAVWRLEWFARGLFDDTDRESWRHAEEEYSAAINAFHECARREVGVPGKYVNREERPEPPERQAHAK